MYDTIKSGDKFRVSNKRLYMACCDCGLVHYIELEAKANGHIFMTVDREDKETKKIRKKHGIRVSKKRGSKW